MFHARYRALKTIGISLSVLALSGASTTALAQPAATQPTDTNVVTPTTPTTTPSPTATDPQLLPEIPTIAPLPPVVVDTWVKKPKSISTEIRSFKPWAQPSPTQMRKIIAIEAKRWGASESRLLCRVHGESTFKWYASNGQYAGALQFARSTLSRGMSTIKTRKVRMVKYRQLTRKVIRYSQWSDGRVTKRVIRKVRVTKRTVYRGMLPKRPGHTHSWAQIRVGAQAMAGKSAVKDSEWEVRC